MTLVVALALAACSSANREAAQRDAQASYKLGVAFLAEGRPAPALRELSKAESTSPDDPEILNALGLAYWARREVVLAESKFRKAVAVNPSYSEAWNNLGAMYVDQGRYNDAIAALEQALRNVFYGTQERALTNLGWALFKAGRAAEGERRLREAIEVAPGFPLARKNLGILLEGRAECGEALTQFDRAAKLLPDDAEIQFHRGICLVKTGDRGAALEAFDRSWRLAPGSEVGRSAKTYLERLQ